MSAVDQEAQSESSADIVCPRCGSGGPFDGEVFVIDAGSGVESLLSSKLGPQSGSVSPPAGISAIAATAPIDMIRVAVFIDVGTAF